ncbi:MAG TPA: glycosyltransferase [Candidatus Saccharimonadales bacterium]|nr:glycosyltransferase [Candidatus Saccharimonadales bacterium]
MAEPKKVAIVCDWLLGTGGAERVVLELHRMYPEAPIYTSQYDAGSKIWYGGEWFQEADVRTGWLQRLPKSLKKFLPVLRAWYFSHLDLSDYDLVISCSGAEAKAAKTGPSTLHICYCHAPTHYYWSRYDEYLAHPGFGRLDFLARFGLKVLVEPLRRWDRSAGKNPDVMLTNSTHTQAMIKKYYRRESVVVAPPVDTARFKPTGTPEPRHGFVTAGRQTPYKRIDLAVAACSQLNVPLIVIGNGPEHQKLTKLAGRSVTFLTNVSDEDIVRHFQTAQAFIFPTNVEDFGITAVEAMAAGTPVIAYAKGGPLDYIVPNKTGLLYEKQTVESLVQTLESFNPARFDSQAIVGAAQAFSVSAFRKHMEQQIAASMRDHSSPQ